MLTVTEQSEKRGSETAMNSETGSGQTQISRAKAWEESWPYLTGLLVMSGYALVEPRIPVSPNLKDALIAVSALAGILAGFFLASAAILVTLKDSWFMKRAVESGVYISLIGYLL